MINIFHQAELRAVADAMNISGLLVKESRLLNPKKLGNFKKLNAIKNLVV